MSLHPKSANTVRIIGGLWRGRRIRFDADAPIRPTPDRVRETLFNWLGQDLTGKSCLDLFAGTGALGFEALSRAARQVTLVDASRHVCVRLRETARMLDAQSFTIECCDATEFLAAFARRSPLPAAMANFSGFDIVFVDPPFASGLMARTLALVEVALAPQGVVYLESDQPIVVPPTWHVLRQSKAGAVHYGLAMREER